MPRRRLRSLLLLALIIAATACATFWAAVVRSDAGACGRPGRPPCPLQRWMRVDIAAPMARNDRRRLAENLERLVRLNPEPGEWQNWNRFAREGALRARKGRPVRPSCTSCHRVYRAAYNEKYRQRAVPAPAQ